MILPMDFPLLHDFLALMKKKPIPRIWGSLDEEEWNLRDRESELNGLGVWASPTPGSKSEPNEAGLQSKRVCNSWSEAGQDEDSRIPRNDNK